MASNGIKSGRQIFGLRKGKRLVNTNDAFEVYSPRLRGNPYRMSGRNTIFDERSKKLWSKTKLVLFVPVLFQNIWSPR